MIFIFEGPDGSGKTTLAEKLQQQTGYPLIHHSNPQPGEGWFADYMDLIAKHGPTGLILDRSWTSDFGYAPVFRPTEQMFLPQYQALDCAVKAYGGGVYVYCTSSIHTLWKRCKVRGEDFVKNRLQLEGRYIKIMRCFSRNMKRKVACCR